MCAMDQAEAGRRSIAWASRRFIMKARDRLADDVRFRCLSEQSTSFTRTTSTSFSACWRRNSAACVIHTEHDIAQYKENPRLRKLLKMCSSSAIVCGRRRGSGSVPAGRDRHHVGRHAGGRRVVADRSSGESGGAGLSSESRRRDRAALTRKNMCRLLAFAEVVTKMRRRPGYWTCRSRRRLSRRSRGWGWRIT